MHDRTRTTQARPGRTLSTLALVLLTIVAVLPSAASQEQAQIYTVETTDFNDLLFTNVDTVFDVGLDPVTGSRWVSSTGGLIEIAPDGSSRRLFTGREGLPECGCWALAVGEDAVWVGTDGGLARVDKETGEVQAFTPETSGMPGRIGRAVAIEPGAVWVGTQTGGVGRFDVANGTWVTYPTATPGGTLKPAWDLLLTAEHVYAAVEGAGLQRLARGEDEEINNFNPFLTQEEGLPTDEVLSVDIDGNGVFWVGTSKGLVRYDPEAAEGGRIRVYGTLDGFSHEQILDVAVHDRSEGRVWTATPQGVNVLDPDTGQVTVYGVVDGLLSNAVNRVRHYGDQDWFATSRGLNIADRAAQNWSYFTAGNAPASSHFTHPVVHDGLVWLGTQAGLSAYDPENGRWYNFDRLNGVTRAVQDIAVHGGDLWLATIGGIYQFDPAVGEVKGTIKDVRENPLPNRQFNVFYHVGVDGDHLWMPEHGYGLLVYEFATEDSEFYGYNQGVDFLITDAKPVGDSVWIASANGLYKFDKATRAIVGEWSWFKGDLPTDALTSMRVDGTDLWITTADAGVIRWSTTLERARAVYNSTSHGLPGDYVRAVFRDGNYLWVGTQKGLARVDLATDETRTFTPEDGLVHEIVVGLTLHDDILYVSTNAGLARLDTRTLEFLPLRVGPDEPILPGGATDGGGNGSAPNLTFRPRLAIQEPVQGDVVSGNVTVQGTASVPGGTVDLVEVSIDGGEWQAARGTESWTFTWDTTGVATKEGTEVWVRARARAGDELSEEKAAAVIAVSPPTIPLTIQHEPPANAYVGVAVPLTVYATGDPPLGVTVFYKREQDASFRSLGLTRLAGDEYGGELPALRAPGNVTYFIEGKSGLLRTVWPRSAEDEAYHTIAFEPPLEAPARLAGPAASVDVTGGKTTAFTVSLASTAEAPETYTVRATGARSAWVSFGVEGQREATVRLDPGTSRDLEVLVAAPADVFAATGSLRLEASLSGEPAAPVSVDVPIRILEAATRDDGSFNTTTSSGQGGGGGTGIPGPGMLAVVGVVALAAARMGRRRD